MLFLLIIGLQRFYDTRFTSLQTPHKEHHVVIVVCSYNNLPFYQKNLDSILSQDYHNYHVVYIDDHSPDGTGEAVQRYIQNHHLENKITLIENPVNTRQLRNTYYAVHQYSHDDDVIIILDGDDWFAHPQVLSALNMVYQNPDVWMTSGNYIQDRGFLLVPNYTPPHTYDVTTLRSSYNVPPPHLRSFYSWLFKQIPLEDLLFEGAFIPMAADMAYLFPMLEMADKHFQPIVQPLYIYNTSGMLNCYHNSTSKQLQAKHAKLLQQKMPYHILEKPVLTKIETTQSNLDALFLDTKASIITLATREQKQDIKPAHSTYLWDSMWTYQLGWQPEIPYDYQVKKHIINPNEHDAELHKLVTKSINTLPITDIPSLQNKVGILLFTNH